MVGPDMRILHLKRTPRMRLKNHSEKSESKPMTIFAKKHRKRRQLLLQKLFFPQSVIRPPNEASMV